MLYLAVHQIIEMVSHYEIKEFDSFLRSFKTICTFVVYGDNNGLWTEEQFLANAVMIREKFFPTNINIHDVRGNGSNRMGSCKLSKHLPIRVNIIRALHME